jgi:Ni/Fe-hydrogenase subunit HybB-like protein
VLVVLGFITHRLNVSVTGMETASGVRYMPRWTEFAVTLSIVAVGFAVFRLAAKHLPIFAEESSHAVSASSEPALAASGAKGD